MRKRDRGFKEEAAQLSDEKQAKRVRRENILRFMNTVMERENLLTAFDEPPW
ncbi:MAG: hypothetical protein ABF904_07290 [Ethanoligenens sp.]